MKGRRLGPIVSTVGQYMFEPAVYIDWDLRKHVFSMCGPPTKKSPSLVLLNKACNAYSTRLYWPHMIRVLTIFIGIANKEF